MGVMAILQKTEQSLRKRIETALGSETAVQQFMEIRRAVFEKVESAIVQDASGKYFPYVRVRIDLYPPSDEMWDSFAAAFLQEDSLKADIRQMLMDPAIRHPQSLDIAVELQKRPDVHRPESPRPKSPRPESARPDGGQAEDSLQAMFEVSFIKPEPAVRKEMPEIGLRIVRGATEQPDYCLQKERILIGRTSDVMDREGRIVRKNDIVFLDNGEDINSTVGYAHARIWWDAAQKEFFLMDEASRYSTCIVRQGRSLDVPAGDPAGVCLRSGDEVFCGQACLRFEIRSAC